MDVFSYGPNLHIHWQNLELLWCSYLAFVTMKCLQEFKVNHNQAITLELTREVCATCVSIFSTISPVEMWFAYANFKAKLQEDLEMDDTTVFNFLSQLKHNLAEGREPKFRWEDYILDARNSKEARDSILVHGDLCRSGRI